MDELKPCPFCGEKQDIDYGIMTGTMRGFDYVQCQTCGAEIHAIHKGRYIAIGLGILTAYIQDIAALAVKRDDAELLELCKGLLIVTEDDDETDI